MKKTILVMIFAFFIVLTGCKTEMENRADDWLGKALSRLTSSYEEVTIESVDWLCETIEDSEDKYWIITEGVTCWYYIVFKDSSSDEVRFARVEVHGDLESQNAWLSTRSSRKDLEDTVSDRITLLEGIIDRENDEDIKETYETTPDLTVSYEQGSMNNRQIRRALYLE